MWDFGARSRENLDGCHPDLQALALAVMALQVMDFSCTEGPRTLETHQELQDKDPPVTWVGFNRSKHSHVPSSAMHLEPYPINYEDTDAYSRLIGMAQAVAAQMGIGIRLGALWKTRDYAHIELT